MVRRIVRLSFHSLLLVLFIIFLASIYLIVQERMSPNQVPSLFSYHPLSVLSNSMEPTFSAGDMVVAKQVNPTDIQTGDIITYYDDKMKIITHRVIETGTEDGTPVFQTQGDNNNVEDNYTVAAEQVIGSVSVVLPYGGYIAQFLGSPLGVVLFIILPTFSFVGITIYEWLDKRNKTDQKSGQAV